MDGHLLVRWLHISAAMLIGGGAGLLAMLCWQPTRSARTVAILDIARQYEFAS